MYASCFDSIHKLLNSEQSDLTISLHEIQQLLYLSEQVNTFLLQEMHFCYYLIAFFSVSSISLYTNARSTQKLYVNLNQAYFGLILFFHLLIQC